MFGEVELDHIDTSCSNYPIIIRLKGVEGHESLTSEGKMFVDYDGECVLFPSREERDWSKFNPKKDRLVSTCEFKDGDIVATNSGSRVFILQRAYSDVKGYCYVGYDFDFNEFFFSCRRFDRLASEEEKQKLFDAIKERGYRWNAETKTLEKLVEPKFDPNTLLPYDRVLVRDKHYNRWRCSFYSHVKENSTYKYAVSGFAYAYCIPYNEETKHLVGTRDEAPEYYRYWED